MNALLLAVLGGLIGAFGPVLLIRANGRERRKDQRLTWERDDRVAAQAAEAARLLLASQEAAIRRTDEVARHVAAASTETAAKLDALDQQGRQIHTLVNRRLTVVTQQALTATVALLETLEETERQQAASGRPTPAKTAARIERARREVEALRGTLAERHEQQAVVDAAEERGGTA